MNPILAVLLFLFASAPAESWAKVTPLDHDLFLLGVPEGGTLTCGLSFNLTIGARLWSQYPLAPDSPLDPNWVDTGGCSVFLYEELGDGTEAEGSVDGDRLVASYPALTTTVALARDSLIAGTVHVADFCPGGLQVNASSAHRYFFQAWCDMASGVTLRAVTPVFTPSLPLAAVLPSPWSVVLPSTPLNIRVAVSKEVPFFVPYDSKVVLSAWSADESLASSSPPRTRPADDGTTLYHVAPLPHTAYRLDATSAHLTVDWLPKQETEDDIFFIEFAHTLGGGETLEDNRLLIPVTAAAPEGDPPPDGFGYRCDPLSMAAFFAQRTYGIENSQVYGWAESRIAPSPRCVTNAVTGDPFSVVPVLLFGAGKFHLSVYAYEPLAEYLLGSATLGVARDSGLPSISLSHTLIVAFRGTEGNLQDWLTNLDARGVDCDGFGYPCSVPDDDDSGSGVVHRGFFTEYQTVRPLLLTLWRRLAARPLNSGEVKIVFVGHSQGGALASLASLEASSELRGVSLVSVSTVTFGAPKVGFGEYGEMQERLVGRGRHWRVETRADPVTFVPPLYSHVGTKIGLPCPHWFLVARCHSLSLYLSLSLSHSTHDDLPPWEGTPFVTDATLSVGLREREREGESGEGGGVGVVVAAVAAALVALSCCASLSLSLLFLLRRKRRSAIVGTERERERERESVSTAPSRRVSRHSSAKRVRR